MIMSNVVVVAVVVVVVAAVVVVVALVLVVVEKTGKSVQIVFITFVGLYVGCINVWVSLILIWRRYIRYCIG